MHQLVLDIGNTATKAGVFEQDRLLHHFVLNHFEPEAFRNELKPFKVKRAIIAASGLIPEALLEALHSLQITLLPFPQNPSTSFHNNYQSAKTLGQDRLALLEGAFCEYAPPFLVISCGTCITYNFVDETGSFLGGAISPGLQMRAKAMSHFTAQLPEVNITKMPSTFIGTDTQSCLQIGASWGFMQEIEGFIKQYQLKYPKISIILTGGDALYLESQPKNRIFVDLFLTLKGLNKILQQHEI